MVEPKCIIPGSTKTFSSQNGEKTEGRKWSCLMDENTHVHLHMGFIRMLLFFTFFTIFFFLPSRCCLHSFYLFIGQASSERAHIYFFFCFVLCFFNYLDVIFFFFLKMIFLINFCDCSFFFFGCLSLFLVLIGHLFFNKCI